MIRVIVLTLVQIALGEHIEFHLLTPDGYPKNIGLLLVAKEDRIFAVSFDAVRYAQNREKICQIMGFDTDKSSFMYVDTDIAQFPSEDLKNHPVALVGYNCPLGKVQNASDCSYIWKGPFDDIPAAFIMCGQRHNGDLQFQSLQLLSDKTGDVREDNPGVAVLQLINPQTEEVYVSTICEADEAAANLACQYLGYRRARHVGRNNFNYLSSNYTKYFNTLVYRASCEGATEVDQCKVEYINSDTVNTESCQEGKELALTCQNDNDFEVYKWVIVNEKDGEWTDAKIGIPYVDLEMTDGSIKSGFIHSANYRALQLACEFMGKKSVGLVARNTNFKYISKEFLTKQGYLIESISCPENAKSLQDCFIDFAKEDFAKYGEETIFECSDGKEDDDYELDQIYLIKTDSANKNLKLSNPGVVYTKVDNHATHTNRVGFVYSANKYAMELACKHMGYKGLRNYEYNSEFSTIDYDWAKRIGYLIDEVYCPETAKDFKDCEVRFSNESEDKKPGHELVLHCSSDDDGKDDDYELDKIYLIKTDSANKNLKISNPGAVYTKVYNHATHTDKGGFVISANKYAMELACKHMGYKGLRNYEYNYDFSTVDYDSAKSIGYLIDEVYCPEDAKDFNDCKVSFSDESEDKKPGHELVLHCSSDDDGKDDDEDGIGAIEYSFGGFKSKIKINKTKGKVLIEDILDYIF